MRFVRRQSMLLKLNHLVARFGVGVFIALIFACALFVLAGMLTKDAWGQQTSIPRAAQPHKAALIKAAHYEFGLDAPVALLAAQIHAESHWRPDVTSALGAQGLAQFMPATARWLPEVAPHTGKPEPYSPGWSIRAMCAYDNWILKQISAENSFERWAMTLSAYNGGLGWLKKDKRKALAEGFDSQRWFNHIENVNAGRKKSAFDENRGYPRRILLTLMPVYEQAGWGRGVVNE